MKIKPTILWPGRETTVAAGTSWFRVTVSDSDEPFVRVRGAGMLHQVAERLQLLLERYRERDEFSIPLDPGSPHLVCSCSQHTRLLFFGNHLSEEAHEVTVDTVVDLQRWLACAAGGEPVAHLKPYGVISHIAAPDGGCTIRFVESRRGMGDALVLDGGERLRLRHFIADLVAQGPPYGEERLFACYGGRELVVDNTGPVWHRLSVRNYGTAGDQVLVARGDLARLTAEL